MNLIAFKASIPSRNSIAEYTSIFNQGRFWGDEILPAPRPRVMGLPERAGNYLQQALDAINAPEGAVMLAGSRVDAMLKEKGYTEGTVFKRIEQAVADHVLTPAMGEWEHSDRLNANAPRHADLDAPHATQEEARQTIEFVKALGEFLFIIPARIEAGKSAARAASQEEAAE